MLVYQKLTVQIVSLFENSRRDDKNDCLMAEFT